MNHPNLDQKIGLKQMKIYVEDITQLVKSKTTMLRSSDSYIHVKGNNFFFGKGIINTDRAANRNNKPAIFQNCAPFTDCIS